MPTPTERLEQRQQLMACRVCAWLATLDEKDHREWQKAIANTRYSHGMVASEIQLDQRASAYDGQEIGEASIETHRKRMHR